MNGVRVRRYILKSAQIIFDKDREPVLYVNGHEYISIDGEETLKFNGPDYKPKRDNFRLGSQIEKIFNLMNDGKWRTLNEILRITGAPPPLPPLPN